MNSRRGLICVVAIIIALYYLSNLWILLFLSGLIAYLGDPLVERLVRCRVPRTMGVVIVFLILIMIVVSLLLLFIPLLAKQLEVLMNWIPLFVNEIHENVLPWLSTHFSVQINADLLKTNLSDNVAKAGSFLQWFLHALTSSGKIFVEGMIDTLVVLVAAFYLMRDWPLLLSSLQSLLPRRYLPTVLSLTVESNEVLGAFLRGQLLIMILLAIIYALGLSLVGIHVALLIGVIAGLLSIVPCLGSLLGVICAVIAAVLQYHAWHPVLWVLFVFAIGHLLENFVLTPLLMGHRLGLHPVAIIFALLAGGMAAGFLGILLALPVAAVAMVFIRYYKKRYLASALYRTEDGCG